jgi:hypothetical protein
MAVQGNRGSLLESVAVSHNAGRGKKGKVAVDSEQPARPMEVSAPMQRPGGQGLMGIKMHPLSQTPEVLTWGHPRAKSK